MTDVPLAGATAPEALRVAFLEACRRPTSIHQHLTVLRDTASGLRHVTELGVGEGNSTLAFLLVQPDVLCSYDLGWQDCVPALERMAGRTHFRFVVGHSHLVEIEETDLLFVDTIHEYTHLKKELCRHAGKVRKYILLHDTTTFGDVGEDHRPPGLWRAVEEFLAANADWSVFWRHTHNNGLTCLRKGPYDR